MILLAVWAIAPVELPLTVAIAKTADVVKEGFEKISTYPRRGYYPKDILLAPSCWCESRYRKGSKLKPQEMAHKKRRSPEDIRLCFFSGRSTLPVGPLKNVSCNRMEQVHNMGPVLVRSMALVYKLDARRGTGPIFRVVFGSSFSCMDQLQRRPKQVVCEKRIL